MIETRNHDIRTKITESGLKYWEIAEALGIRPDKFSVIMRYPLAEEMKAKILQAIEIAKGGRTANV